MGPLSRLVKDTSIYGLSSILARMINFFFVPLYTRELTKADYGIYSEVFAYIAVLQVVLTFGMETGFFRFASRSDRDPQLVFSTLLHSLGASSLAFFVLILLLAENIAGLMGYATIGVVYIGAILALDSYTSILFARLRYERKAMKFAIFRTVKISGEVLFNFVFFFLLPPYFVHHPDSWLLQFFGSEPSYLYILAAVLGSCLVAFFLFIPQILRTAFKISKTYLREILLFSFPLMITGLQGTSSDFADRLLFRFFTPEDLSWEEQLGLFNASAKLTVILIMFVQMFRYAAEPFFFSVADQSDSKQVYARVMKYFTIFCVAIFLFMTLYMEAFQYILGKDFRSGLVVVPILLLSNLLLGINQNLSMWYKLSGKTKMAMIITFVGLLTTITVNVLFMPKYGYYAAACGHLVSYLIMLVLSWQLSKKYYRIPYQWGQITMYILLGIGLYLVSCLLESLPMPVILFLNTLLLAAYVGFVIKFERIDVKALALTVRTKVLRR